jgi:hypothetical protein
VPVEANPRGLAKVHELGLRQLVLDVRGFVEAFVVIDTKWQSALADGSPGTRDLRREEARGYRTHHNVAGDVVEVGHVCAEREARNFGIMPVDGEGDGGVAEDGEVEGVVGVFPDIVAAQDDSLAQVLLESRVKLVAEAGLEGAGDAGGAGEERAEDLVAATRRRCGGRCRCA